MSLITHLSCVTCAAQYPEGSPMTCPACGPAEGILDVHFDLGRAAKTLTRQSLTTRTRSLWRYRELLPLDDAHCPTAGDVGFTPLIESPHLADALGVRRIRLKDDGRSASGSFKDRASAIGVARAIQEGFDTIACASTGNAATSCAYCAAAAGIRANIFVSRIVPAGKLAQLLAYGARVFKVEGTYAQAYDLCAQACAEFGWYVRNCAVNPYLVEGKKTGGLEVAEQCADDPPDWVAASVGDGCSIAGVQKGFAQMKEIDIIDWSPRMLGVQAAGVAPIANMWHQHPTDSGNTTVWHRFATGDQAEGDTYADSINVPVPRNWRKALNAVRNSNGTYVTVTDEQIMLAVRETGRLAATFAEPAAAAAIAGIAQARREGILDAKSNVVAMITGNGLKDIDGAMKALGQPHTIQPDLAEVAKIVASEA